jgi:hypothetical protein
MCIALFAALPAPLFEPVECRELLRRRTRCYPAQQNDDSLLEPLRIVPHSDHQLDDNLRPDALLLEDGPDGCIELAHLIVEVLVATGERLEGDVRGRAQGRASRTRPTLMQRDLGTRRAIVIAHYWSHTVSGAETIRERICSIAALCAFSADALALVRTCRLSTMSSLAFTVTYRALLLASLCAIAASSLPLLRLTVRSGVLTSTTCTCSREHLGAPPPARREEGTLDLRPADGDVHVPVGVDANVDDAFHLSLLHGRPSTAYD